MFTRQVPLGIPIANTPLGNSSGYGVGVWLDQRDGQGNLIGAIAAGARGFSSWIDFDDGMVGVFSTDLSASGNVQTLLYLLRDAAQAAIRNPLPCLADFNNDGAANSQDFFDSLRCADITTPDGGGAGFQPAPSLGIEQVGNLLHHQVALSS